MIKDIIYYKLTKNIHTINMKFKKNDLGICFTLLVFFFVSILSIYTARNYMTISNITIKQIIFYLLGIGLLITSYKYKETIIKYATLWYIGLNILLLFLLIFGISINGSKCWIFIGPFSFQPSEFMKISLIILIAKMVSEYDHSKSLKKDYILLLKIMIIVIIPTVLTFLEPDTGVVLIYFIASISIIFIRGINKKWYIITILLLVLICSTIIMLYYFEKDILIKFLGTNIFYRIERILSWSNQSGYQLENSLIVISTSGIIGHGMNNIPLYFPEASTDFIFTSYSSIFGFIGITFLFLAIIYFDISLINISKQKIPSIDKLILSGFISMITFQQIQNIGMTIGLLPITGITLPFISYGGTSLLSYMVVLGIVLNISATKKRFINK